MSYQDERKTEVTITLYGHTLSPELTLVVLGIYILMIIASGLTTIYLAKELEDIKKQNEEEAEC